VSRRDGRRSLDVADAPQVGIEARQPGYDFLTCHDGIPQLAMLLRSLACCEDPRRHGPGANEFAHGPVDPAHTEQVILLAFSKKDILFHVVQNTIQ
jgi:hypothetical protein